MSSRMVLLDAGGNFVNRLVYDDKGSWQPPKGHTLEDAVAYDARKLREEAAADRARIEPLPVKTAEDYRLLMRAYRNEGNPDEEKRVYLEAQEALKNAPTDQKRTVKWKGEGDAPVRVVTGAPINPRGR